VFADFGADVIKIEAPAGLDPNENVLGERDGPDFQNLHRNKRSVSLNLKLAGDKQRLLDMVKDADVLVENFRPGVMDRLGLGYEILSALNPRIILASISGFGQSGPYRKRPGFDQVIQGMGGFMSMTGFPENGPTRAGAAVADVAAGMNLAIGILIALHERSVSGRGQWVQTSLLQSMIAMLDFQAARYLMNGEIATQCGNDHPTSMPASAYPTRDGAVNIAAHGDGMWEKLCVTLGKPEWLQRPEFAGDPLRRANRAELNAAISAVTALHDSNELVERLNNAGVACGPIYNIAQVFADPQTQHLNVATPVEHKRLGKLSLVAQPIDLSRTPSAVTGASPECGEHNEQILR
jgi:formyl-CoA transferase